VDAIVSGQRLRRRERTARADREGQEGPETADRVVTGAAAGVPGCDVVIVSSRRKPGWERGVAVFTPDGCYRLGDPVERVVGGRQRYLYPLSEHADLEAIRRSVQYEPPKSLTGVQETRRPGGSAGSVEQPRDPS